MVCSRRTLGLLLIASASAWQSQHNSTQEWECRSARTVDEDGTCVDPEGATTRFLDRPICEANGFTWKKTNEESSSIFLIIGAGLSLGAAALGACSMNIQQLSLTSETLPPLKKNLFWFLGLVLYLISQLISVAAVGYAPLALVAALFTTMLFFDVIIARCFLKKTFTTQHMCGIGTIVISVTLIAVFAPQDEYDVTAPCMYDWLKTWSGFVSLCFLFCILLSCAFTCVWFNNKYPNFRTPDEKLDPGGGPSDNLKLMMMVLYPTTLAIFETFGQMSLKGLVNMAKVPTFEIPLGESPFDHPMFFVTFGAWICCVANTVMWLRKVYSKFTTVECLPIEYGLVGVLSIFGSLMFYQEHKDSAVTLEMVSLGCCGILAGIAIMVHGKHGTLKPPETEAERKLHDASAGMRSGNTFRIRQGLRGAWRHAIFIQKLMDGVITQEEYRMLVNSNRRFTAAAQEDEAREEEQVMAEEFAAEDLEAALENLEAGVEEGANGRTRARTHSRERSISVAMAMEALEAMRPPTAKERWEKVRMQIKPAMRMVLLHKELAARKQEKLARLKADKTASSSRLLASPNRKKAHSSLPPSSRPPAVKGAPQLMQVKWQHQNDPATREEVRNLPPLHYGNLFQSLCEKPQQTQTSVIGSVGIV